MSILQILVQILAAWGPSHSGNRNVAQVARNVACNGVGKGPCSAIEHAIGFGSAYTVLILFPIVSAPLLAACRDFWNVGADTDVSEGSESTVWAFWQNLFSVTRGLIPH